MGVRGEIFSNRIILPNRTYFFNVKENRMGDLYLNIVESKNRDNGGFERQSVILFADDLQEFLKGFDESLRVLEKAAREKRRGGEESPKRGEKREEKTGRREKAEYGERDRYSQTGEKPPRGERRGENDRYSRTGEKSPRGDKSRKSDRGSRGRDNERGFEHGERSRESKRGYERGPKSRDSERGSDRGAFGGRRVVVKKRGTDKR